MGRSAKSWSLKATTFLSATNLASSSFPALLNLLSCTPVTSVPIVGVKSLVVTPLARSSGNFGSASRPWSRCSNGSRGGKLSIPHVGR